ncbi:hypothetical protein [Bacterioplanoides pacificum]|uniref:Uncharacterized protein n=1 Tax=Bacterioplanoides pacificum TaxID=1171596 RepID=A0ABV7VQ30_9GAMM
MAKKSNKVKKVKTQAHSSGSDMAEDNKNPAISRFESVFYRFFAWFPILVLPAMVWDMMAAGDYVMGGIIGFVHAILVFRFVTVVNLPGLFKRKQTAEN